MEVKSNPGAQIIRAAEELPLTEILQLDAPMTVEQACQYLQCHRNSLLKWIQNDEKFPARRVGREYRFYRSELDAWVRNQTKG